MNRKNFLRSIVCTTLALGSLSALAVEGGTADEAKALAQRAVALFKSKGADAAYAEFTTGTAFKDRDLYVAAFDMKGNCLAHGGNPKLVGKNLWELKDANGVEFVKMQTNVALGKGSGWTDPFIFVNPQTKALQTKAAYVERAGDNWISVGYYK